MKEKNRPCVNRNGYCTPTSIGALKDYYKQTSQQVYYRIEKICKDQLGSKFIEVEIQDTAGQPGTKMVIQTRDLFNKLFNSDLPISKCVAMIKFPMIDKYGNESNDNVMKCTLTDTTAAKIN